MLDPKDVYKNYSGPVSKYTFWQVANTTTDDGHPLIVYKSDQLTYSDGQHRTCYIGSIAVNGGYPNGGIIEIGADTPEFGFDEFMIIAKSAKLVEG